MTTGFRAAIGAIVGIIEATPPVSTSHGFGSAFRHAPSASRGALPSTRGFFVEVVDGARKGPYTTGQRRYVRTVEVVVCYQHQADQHEATIVVEEDRVSLTEALLNVDDWDESTTGIVGLTEGVPGSQDTVLVASKEQDEGATLLVFTLALEVIEG